MASDRDIRHSNRTDKCSQDSFAQMIPFIQNVYVKHNSPDYRIISFNNDDKYNNGVLFLTEEISFTPKEFLEIDGCYLYNFPLTITDKANKKGRESTLPEIK